MKKKTKSKPKKKSEPKAESMEVCGQEHPKNPLFKCVLPKGHATDKFWKSINKGKCDFAYSGKGEKAKPNDTKKLQELAKLAAQQTLKLNESSPDPQLVKAVEQHKKMLAEMEKKAKEKQIAKKEEQIRLAKEKKKHQEKQAKEMEEAAANP